MFSSPVFKESKLNKLQSHIKYNFTFTPSLRKYTYSCKTERDAADRHTHTLKKKKKTRFKMHSESRRK